MAFTTQRGRPRTTPMQRDVGTPELRLKHALGLTSEPIDLCLEKRLITPDQHRSGLHLRWLYTLRYGAPRITTHYFDISTISGREPEDPDWRIMREHEYTQAVTLLNHHGHYECLMRLCIFNEHPPFLSQSLRNRARLHAALKQQLVEAHQRVAHGLDLLAFHWRVTRK